MEKTATVKANDLPTPARDWLGEVLNLDLADSDVFTVTVHRPAPDPASLSREVARERLLELMKRIGDRTENVPDAEIDEAINEAMHFACRTPTNVDHD